MTCAAGHAEPADSPTLHAAIALAPRIRASAETIEQLRRIPMPIVEALRDAGVFGMAMPHAWGGPELDPLTQFRVIEAIAPTRPKRVFVVADGPRAERGPRADGSRANASRRPAAPQVKPSVKPPTSPKAGDIAPNGMRPFTLYAHPRQMPAGKGDAPRIAIIVGGLGISASGTADALAKLPAPVTLAVAPYGAALDNLAERAQAGNHEVLLQAPMEPFDYPDNDPGPQTLLTSLTPEQNIDRLHWQMSRFQGYVGIVSFMGARFTASETALAPIMRETAKRGLIYVDDGASSRSVAGQLAGSQNLPFAKTDVVIDTVPTAVEIDRALARLEIMARDHGTAVGLATALPGTVTRIAEWAKKAEARGFILVPITMVAVKEKSS